MICMGTWCVNAYASSPIHWYGSNVKRTVLRAMYSDAMLTITCVHASVGVAAGRQQSVCVCVYVCMYVCVMHTTTCVHASVGVAAGRQQSVCVCVCV
jgi:hypothetical protein